MPLPFEHDIQDCLQAAIGEGGLPEGELDALVSRALPALRRLAERPPACIAVARESADLAALSALAAEWRGRFRRVLLLGTGGSSLGARVLVSALPAAGPEIEFLDNLDLSHAERIAAAARAEDQAFLVVSKSGGTAETLAQALLAVDAVASCGEANIGDRFLAMSQPGDSPLRRLAAANDIPVVDLDPAIDGRFSVLSPVGLLPALMAGLDAAAIRAGAAEVLEATLAAPRGASGPAGAAPALGAALQVGLSHSRGVTQSVLLAYGDRLDGFALWYRQLWAESLGKDGRGTTPIRALGPLDQHSQLQLYLDGPWDKLFTILTLPLAGAGPRLDGARAKAFGIEDMGDHALGDLLEAMQNATADALAARGRPVRRLRLARLDERTLGALFMHFMLETLIAADLLGVEPFGQPAVEASKALIAERLAAMAPARRAGGRA